MSQTLWGYSDPSKSRAPHLKLRDAIIFYKDVRGKTAIHAIVSSRVIEDVANRSPISVEGRAHVPWHTFFLLAEEGE